MTTRHFNGLQIPAAGTYQLDPGHKRVGFAVKHLMVSKVRGQFTDATATIVVADNPLDSHVTATIGTASIDTGHPDRDDHLRNGDFLDTHRFPDMTFRSTGIRDWSATTFTLTGELTIKDVTRPVELTVEFEGATTSPYGQHLFGFSAHTDIDREHWGLTYNMALEAGAVMIGKKVRLEIEGEAVLQP
jgi:polyisoprenoid-binding protein YceI